jgi:hypothetical protein
VLGGVPSGKIRYDSLKAAVAQVTGLSRSRVEADRWTACRSHWASTLSTASPASAAPRFAQVMVRNNRYSVPVRLIGRRVRVLLHASRLVIYDGRTEAARHERLPGRGGARLDLDHYLEALVRKPGALPGATALEQTRAAGKFTPVHDAWWAAARKAHGDAAGTRALVEVLLLHRHMDGEHVVAGLAAALRAGALTADAVALEARKAADETAGQPAPDTAPAVTAPVASLTARRLEKLPPDTRPLPSVAAYDQLLRRTRAAQEGTRP